MCNARAFQKLFLNQCCYDVSKLVQDLNFFENDPLHSSLLYGCGQRVLGRDAAMEELVRQVAAASSQVSRRPGG